MAEAIAVTVRRWGGIDGLFNNAGIMPHEDVNLLGREDDIWCPGYALNVHGTAPCSKHVIPCMPEARGAP